MLRKQSTTAAPTEAGEASAKADTTKAGGANADAAPANVKTEPKVSAAGDASDDKPATAAATSSPDCFDELE